VTRFALVFAALLAVLFGAELTAPVQHAVVVPWTEALARATAGIVTLFDGNVASQGRVLYAKSSGFSISIESGCNGVEAALILIAAMVAFRAPIRSKAIGIVAGVVAVQLLNLVRLVSLFYLGQWSPAAFEWAHLYVWQALIMLDVLIVWLVWLRTLPPPEPEPEAGPLPA
jgi:exosortase H (IPTLxxWG-CTERM-specific)